MASSYSSYLSVPIKRVFSPEQNVGKPIPQYPGPAVSSTIVFSNASDIFCEHVQIVFSSSHPLSTELEVILTSPSGTQSVLADLHAMTVTSSVMVTAPQTSYSLSLTTAARFGAFGSVSGSVANHTNTACNSEMNQNQLPSNYYADKIVLVRRGTCTYAEKAKNLAVLGPKVVS